MFGAWRQAFTPQWSPDGQRIVYMNDSTDGTHIWVMKADGTDPRCLTCSK